ncbi:MAG: hypothetical protein RLZZ480_543 [Candidatus Parcubacteria bacterium]|jgi:hypothetical protein
MEKSMKLTQPVHNESNYELLKIAAIGTFMTWLFGPSWLVIISTLLLFGAYYLFYKSEQRHLDNEVRHPKAEIQDSNGTFVGYTTYRIGSKETHMSEESLIPSPTDEERDALRKEAAQNVPTAHKALGGDAEALAEWRKSRKK